MSEQEEEIFASSSDSSQYISWKARDKKWKSNSNEITAKEIALDFSTLKTGWGIWPEGQAITWTFGSKPSQLPQKPSDQHKQGFYIEAYIEEDKKMTKKVWSSLAFGERETIRLMHKQVIGTIKDNKGKIAVYTIDGANETLKIGKGDTCTAKCTFKGWSAKPAEEEEDSSDDTPIFDID
tara:strand:+ start:717 stop:1256 length:540 start_codon:yes stop_codon:yes gene_type:complete